MMFTNNQFILKPIFIDITKSRIKYTDVLTYVTIRSFNSYNDNCFPSYETIAARSGFGRKFTIESVDRLEKAGYLKVYRSKSLRQPNKYMFPRYKYDAAENPISYAIFELDLTRNELAMLLCLRQVINCYKPSYYSMKHYTSQLGLSYDTISKQFRSLVRKGYINVTINIRGKKLVMLSDALRWHFDNREKESWNNSVAVGDERNSSLSILPLGNRIKLS